MKRLLNQFLKENHLNPEKLLANHKSRPSSLGAQTKAFSCWLSGYKDEQKKNKRFQSTYRVNKFMFRKGLEKAVKATS